jgi:hypothetical protein
MNLCCVFLFCILDFGGESRWDNNIWILACILDFFFFFKEKVFGFLDFVIYGRVCRECLNGWMSFQNPPRFLNHLLCKCI